jgi:hypothetical protein
MEELDAGPFNTFEEANDASIEKNKKGIITSCPIEVSDDYVLYMGEIGKINERHEEI